MALRDVDRFEEIINEIKKLVDWYDNRKFKYKRTKLFLTNNDSFIYSIPEDKVAHLLGVNITYLQSLGMFKNTSSYLLLKEFLKNYHRICDGIRNDTIKLDYIFSKHILKKLDSFKQNIDIYLNNVTFVCKYNREKAYNDGKNTIKSDYSIISMLEDGSILELDLVLSPDKKYAYPVSNKMFDDEAEARESLKSLLEKQEISILRELILYDNDYYYDYKKPKFLNDQDKMERLNIIKKFTKEYGCYIDLTFECERLYKNTKNNREKNSSDRDILDTITDYIANGRCIPIDKLHNISNQHYDLCLAVNDILTKNEEIINDEANQESYSKLRKSVERLREAKSTLIEENKKLQGKIKEQQQKIETLEEDNEVKSNFIDNITNSFSDYNEKIKKISK